MGKRGRDAIRAERPTHILLPEGGGGGRKPRGEILQQASFPPGGSHHIYLLRH